MSFLGGFFGAKKEDPNSATKKNQNNPPLDAQPTKQETPADNNFFGNMQVKSKPAPGAGATKPKAFDPFNIGGASANRPSTGGPNFAGFAASENKNTITSQKSLSGIEDEEQQKPLDESMSSDAPRKSAFGFIQKKPIKPQQTEPSPRNQLSFVTNGTSMPQFTDNPETEYNPEVQSAVNFSDRSPSLTSQASEPVNTGAGKTSAFSFIKKKSTAPVDADTSQAQGTNPPFTGSQQELDNAMSDSRSDIPDNKSVTTPTTKSFGPSFARFKSPQNIETNKIINEDASSLPVAEQKSEASAEKDRTSEAGSTTSSGPSFLKFKQKTDKSQSGEPVQKVSSFPHKPFGQREEESIDQYNASENSTSRNRSEPFGHREVEPQVTKGERISSPLQPIQTPAIIEDEKPYGIKARLEREEGDIFEAIGDLVSRQNNLMAKKSSLETQREGISKKLKTVAQQQNEAIENDNFEEADHLEVVTMELNETYRDLEKQIDDCQLEYADLEKEKQMIYQNRQVLYQTFIGDVENVMLTQNHNFDKYKIESANQQAGEKAYIEEKTKELQYNRNHIDLDLKHINEETNTVTENMNKQIKDYVGDQQELSARKTELETIVERIRRELQEKEEELAEVTKNFNKVNTKINSITSKFDDQLSKIQKKRDKMEADERKYQEDIQKLEQYKERAELSNQRLKEVNDIFEKTCQSYEELKVTFEKDSQRLARENERRERAIKVYYDSLNALRQDRRQLLNCEEEIDKLREDLSKFQRDSVDLTTQKNELNNKIPELEKEKKAFVSSRSFKDASRVSNDIKDIQTKITEIEEQLVQVNENEKATLQKIQTLEKDIIPSLSARVNVTAKESDLNQYELLRVKENDLSLLLNYYTTHRHYDEAHTIEVELKSTQQSLSQLISQYPELKTTDDETAQPQEEGPATEQPEEIQHHHEDVQETTEEQNGHVEEGYQQSPEHNDEPAEIAPEEATYAEPAQDVPLEQLVSEYEDLAHKISEFESLIEQYASEDKFEEADEVSGQQEECRKRQEKIMGQIYGLGFSDLEEAKAEIAKKQENTQQEEEAQPQEEEVQPEAEVEAEEPKEEEVQQEEVKGENEENLI